MKLNLGCGNKRIEGFAGVDLHGDVATIRADLRSVEFAPEMIEAAVTFHVIEHLTYDDGVSLVYRVFEWLQPGGTFAIETPDRAKCLDLIRRGKLYTDGRGVKRLEGGVGILGGRHCDAEDNRVYHRWIRDNAEMIAREAKRNRHVPIELIPERWIQHDTQHLCVWSEAELREVMERVGFQVRAEKPTTHGRRDWRDLRLVGVKL